VTHAAHIASTTMTTDSAGTVTNYDGRGRVISRETTTGNILMTYYWVRAQAERERPG
jgi:hypothetical protein